MIMKKIYDRQVILRKGEIMEIRYIDSTDDKSADILVKQIKYMDWNNMLPHLEALYVLDNA